MKIVVFAEYLPPRLGSDRRIFEIMRRLADRHDIHFIVFPPFRELRNEPVRNGPETYHSSPREDASFEGIRRHSILIPPRIALLWRRSLILAYFLTVMSVFLKSTMVIKRLKPDVIVLNYPSPYTGLLGFLEGKLLKKPIAVDFNDLIAQYSRALLNLKKGSLTARLLVMVQDYIARKSDKIVTPTRFIKNYTVSLGISDDRVEVISNGVDIKSFNSDNREGNRLRGDLHLTGEKLCVYCGRLDDWAGINIISKLCDMAETRRLKVKFLLAGSGEGGNVKKGNVISLGEVRYEQVPAVLGAADAILIPFPNNEVSHAASPLKLFEGMSMQKPVIASRVSGIEEVVSDGQNGFLADPDDLEEWMIKLDTVFASEKLAARVGQNAKRTVEKFDWDLLAEQYEEILNAAIAK